MEPWLVWTVVLLCVATLVTTIADRRAQRLNRRCHQLEQKVDLLIRQLGVELPPDPALDEIDALLRRGKTIEAIKLHREMTGSGLREAKQEIDRRMR